jgi:type IV pilus assembly protein PilA
MLSTLRTRLHNDEDGFTLIELMVVVLIIAILIGIAIPTFLGAQNRAKDRSAQSDLRNSLTAAKTLATDNSGNFLNDAGTVIVAADLGKVEPSLKTQYSDSTAGTTNILVKTAALGADITLVTKSDSGTYFCISANTDGIVTYNSSTTAGGTDIATNATCNNTKW